MSGVAFGSQSLLFGTWYGADRATQAKYRALRISNSFINWSGSRFNPSCRTQYKTKDKQLKAKVEDAIMPPSVINQDTIPLSQDKEPGTQTLEHNAPPLYWVFRLSLKNRLCTRGLSEFQFAVDPDQPDRAEFIAYDEEGKPVSWGHFTRQK
jgi:hypothetical protein